MKKEDEKYDIEVSDVAGLGLSPKPACPRGFLGGPSPPEARPSKPESPAGFFGPKIGQIMGLFATTKIFIFFGRKLAENRPIFGLILAEFVA